MFLTILTENKKKETNTLEKPLDLRGIPCPKNSSLAVIKLSTMDMGEQLTIYLDDGEPIDNVPASLELEGHLLKSKTRDSSGHWILVVEVAA